MAVAGTINWLERLTKIDLDRDGDIGMKGTPEGRELERLEVAKKASKQLAVQVAKMEAESELIYKRIKILKKNIKAKMSKGDEAGALALMREKKTFRKTSGSIRCKTSEFTSTKTYVRNFHQRSKYYTIHGKRTKCIRRNARRYAGRRPNSNDGPN